MISALQLTVSDYIIFFAAIIGAMIVGLIAGRKEETSEDYFLAGKKLRWFAVAGSIFGSNVSANHMVGMMGVGFSIGFAQSHFEIGAIAGLLFLCYGFLPVYRKLNLYTLSEYLGKRYDDRSRVSYAVIMIIIMAFVQMVPALYIGSRTICELLGGNAIIQEDSSAATEPTVVTNNISNSPDSAISSQFQVQAPKSKVSMPHYTWFVIALGVIAGSYTIVGGLKAVVYTDIIQSVLMLIAGIGLAVLVFSQLGWNQMLELDAAAGDASKMNIYLPTYHKDLPWTGVLTGLMCMHCFYWGTNQFIVQRALGAVSDKEARAGIISAGFLKLTIPFFSIATGVCAYYLLMNEATEEAARAMVNDIAPDTVFPKLVTRFISPIGFGLVGLIAAGVIGAILSSIDSMMNSAATIISVDIYKRYFRKDASDRELIIAGRVTIVVLMITAILMAIFVMDPNSNENFFLQIANYQNYLTPGLLVAFVLGIFWKRGTAPAAFYTILAGIVLSWVVVQVYDSDMPRPLYDIALDRASVSDFHAGNFVPAGYLDQNVHDMSQDEFDAFIAKDIRPNISALQKMFGPTLNFFHRVVFVLGLSAIVFVIISLMTPMDTKKSQLTWTGLGGHQPTRLKALAKTLCLSLLIFALLGWLTDQTFRGRDLLTPTLAACFAAFWTLGVYGCEILGKFKTDDSGMSRGQYILRSDLTYAGLLAATAMFMMYFFF
ncbi:MAG: sodium/solute symporter [Planctomycetaceae bacterium]|nr:sodium/solute symporter [Planctomycetaceae bacterium]